MHIYIFYFLEVWLEGFTWMKGLPAVVQIFSTCVMPDQRSRAFGYLVALGSIGQTGLSYYNSIYIMWCDHNRILFYFSGCDCNVNFLLNYQTWIEHIFCLFKFYRYVRIWTGEPCLLYSVLWDSCGWAPGSCHLKIWEF